MEQEDPTTVLEEVAEEVAPPEVKSIKDTESASDDAMAGTDEEDSTGFEAGSTEIDLSDMGDLDDIENAEDLIGSEPDDEDYSALEENHFLFETRELYDQLSPLTEIVKDAHDIYSRVVHVKALNDKVIFTANTGECQAMVKVQLQNNQKVLQGSYTIDFYHLLPVIKNTGKRTVFLEDGDSFKVKVLGGEVQFDCYQLDSDMINKAQTYEALEGFKSIRTVSFLNFCAYAQRSLSLASRQEDRRIKCSKGEGYANFLNSVVLFKDTGVDKFSLRGNDLNYINKAFSGALTLEFLEHEGKYIIKSENKVYATPVIQADDLDFVGTISKSVKKKSSFSMSPALSSKVLSVVKGIVGNSGIISLETVKGEVLIKVLTKAKKELKFPVSTILGAEFVIKMPISSLNSLMLLYKEYPMVDVIYDEENRIVFQSETVDVIIGNVGK